MHPVPQGSLLHKSYVVNTIFKITSNLFDLTTPVTPPLPAYRVATDKVRLKNTQINDSFIGGAI